MQKHRLRGAISSFQGGSFKAGSLSGLTSGFDVGTQGYGGMLGRTSIMAIAGGTFSVIGGGKFSNGAFGGAMTHLFNAEMKQVEIDRHNQKIMANEKAFNTAFGNRGPSYFKGETPIVDGILHVVPYVFLGGKLTMDAVYGIYGYSASLSVSSFIAGGTVGMGGGLISNGVDIDPLGFSATETISETTIK